MEERAINEKESLEIISRMIQSAKTSLSDSSIFYLLWGWLVLIALIMEYVLQKINYPYFFIGWLVLMPAGFVASFIIGSMKSKRQKMRTYIDQFMTYLWSGFGISLLIILFFQQKFGSDAVYPLVFVLYGLGTFVSGGAIQFRPLQIGGVICWSLAIARFFVNHDLQLLFGMIIMLSAYIVPGYLLRAQFKKQKLNPAAS